MKVLVCGGRDFHDWVTVEETLNRLHEDCPITVVIHGGARGADRLGRDWAIKNKIQCREFRAAWDYYGKRAGVIRNAEMLKMGEPNLVVAFAGGRGTHDMVNRSLDAGIKVIKIGWDKP